MTRDNIIRIAKQTAENGTYEIHMIHHLVAGTWLKFICDFGEQVVAESAAAECEACAVQLDEMAEKDKLTNYYKVAAKAIRARGYALTKLNQAAEDNGEDL